MTAPTVFISYSHKDEEWKDRLVTHLGVLQQEGLLGVWDDRRIEVGADWYPEIERAMQAASVAVLLVSANFLTSQFIIGEEVPRLLQRRAQQGVRIFPVIVKPCAWKQVSWLSRLQVRPRDGRPLSGGTEYQIDVDLAAIAEEIAAGIERSERSDASSGFAPPSPKQESSASSLSPTELRQKLITYFNNSELHDLCFDLGIDYESLGGGTRDATVRELILYLQRRDRLGEMIDLCRKMRPSVDWGS